MQGRAKAATIAGVATQVEITARRQCSPVWDLLTENQDRLHDLMEICAATGVLERTLQACCHEHRLRFGIAACSRSSFDCIDERMGRTRLSKIGDATGFELLQKPYAAEEVSRVLRRVTQSEGHKGGQ
jgi:hypothetical protein